MKKLHGGIVVYLLLAASLAVAGAQGQSQHAPGITLSGMVSGASGKHPVYVALWDAASFLKKPVQQVRIEPGAPALFRFRAAAGDWALSAFEDKNEDGVLDMGAFGPKEPSGFWRAFRAWRKPRFADVSSRFDQDTPGIQILLH